MVTRFAPTPSGYLHLGNAFSFLLTWVLARQNKGKILLRIDDLDAERKRPEFVADIFDSLQWLGLDWELGPVDASDFEANWTQAGRLPLYEAALAKLKANNMLFACTCTRSQLRLSHGGQRYPGTCEFAVHDFGGECAWRLRVPDDAIPVFTEWNQGPRAFPLGKETGCFVLRRREGIPSYHLASLVDDLHFGVNFIVRGGDLLAATAAQVHLSQSLDEPTFAQANFLHHPLLAQADGSKLSKSAGAESLQALRKAGVKPAELIAKFAAASGLSAPLPASPAQLADAFNPSFPLQWNRSE